MYMFWTLVNSACGGLGNNITMASLSEVGAEPGNNEVAATTAALQGRCHTRTEAPGISDLLQLLLFYTYATVAKNNVALLDEGISKTFDFGGLESAFSTIHTSSLDLGDEKK